MSNHGEYQDPNHFVAHAPEQPGVLETLAHLTADKLHELGSAVAHFAKGSVQFVTSHTIRHS